MTLIELLKIKVKEWREDGYPSEFKAIKEIFEFAYLDSKIGHKRLQYLRTPQYQALEIYWYLRLIEKTNKIYHIPKVLYHWRTITSSAANSIYAKPYAYEKAKRDY